MRLLLNCTKASSWHRLSRILLLRLSEKIKWVLSGWPLRLISLHTHSTCHSSHTHRLLLLLELLLLELLLLELLLLLLLHATHAHWLELPHHWLETTCCLGGWSVESITVLLMCHSASTLIHQLAEGVIARQVTLSLKLILLSTKACCSCRLLLLLILVVEAVKDRVFVISRDFVLCRGQWLVISCKDIVKLVIWGLLAITARCHIC